MSWRDDLAQEPWRFDFIGVLMRAEAEAANKPRIGDSATRRDEFIDLGQEPHLSFPASNVAFYTDDGGTGRPRLRARFLGMLGPMGPLPLTTTEEALKWYAERDDAFVRFLDIFNNRFLQLFYRALADARPAAQASRPDDRFAMYLGAAYGIGGDAWRDLDSMPDRQKLSFAGLLATRSRSASRVEDLIAGTFGINVRIDQFVGSILRLAPDEQTRLGRNHTRLGQDALLGAEMLSLDAKVRIVLDAPDLATYRKLLPGGALSQRLVDTVTFALGPEYDWEIGLTVPASEPPPTRLGSFGRLGWTTWAGEPETPASSDRVGTRFSPEAFGDIARWAIQQDDQGRM